MSNSIKNNIKSNIKWWQDKVIYQIYPKSFKDSNGDGIGDLPGIISKLDYLHELGVELLWLSPIYASPMKDNGYDISDYYDIAPCFGTMADFDLLVSEAKKRNIQILMDLVVNHCSDKHPWFVEARKSKDNPYRNYFIWKDAKPNGGVPNNWTAWFSPSVWKWDENTKQYYFFLFSEFQPDLNWENPALRQEIYKMMRFWLDKGVAGFRMDTLNLYSKHPDFPAGDTKNYNVGKEHFMNGPKIHDYIKEMRREVLSKYQCVNVGETPGVSPQTALLYVGQDENGDYPEVEMLFQFEQHMLDTNGVDEMAAQKLHLIDLKDNWNKWQTELHGKGWNSLYWSNHDQPRSVSRWGCDEPQYRVVSAKTLGTLLHFLQGTPYIYQGEELGLVNTKYTDISQFEDIYAHSYFNRCTKELGVSPDEVMRRLNIRSRDHARVPMAWTTGVNNGFSDGAPDKMWIKTNPVHKDMCVDVTLADKDSVFYHYKKLVSLRKQYPIIITGKFELYKREDTNVFSYLRKDDTMTLLVVANFYRDERDFDFTDLNIKNPKVLIQNYKDLDIASVNSGKVKLRPFESFVLQY